LPSLRDGNCSLSMTGGCWFIFYCCILYCRRLDGGVFFSRKNVRVRTSMEGAYALAILFHCCLVCVSAGRWHRGSGCFGARHFCKPLSLMLRLAALSKWSARGCSVTGLSLTSEIFARLGGTAGDASTTSRGRRCPHRAVRRRSCCGSTYLIRRRGFRPILIRKRKCSGRRRRIIRLQRSRRRCALPRPPGEGPPNEFAKEEDLGIREMEGVSAHGVRQTQTIPAESSGTGAEIVITDEYWYSADLRINLMIKHSDPRTGSVTMTVTQISRTEPDAVFFDVPEGYRPPKGAKGAE